jgi:hypothetical protein
MLRLLSAMPILACAFAAFATSISRVPVSELFQEADVVALAQVTEGRTLGVGDQTCGATYEALVLDGLKGVRAGATIKFGHYSGYEVGTRYLLFLAQPERSFDPKLSANSDIERGRKQLFDRCSVQWRELSVIHSGNGALSIMHAPPFNYKDAVRIASRYVGIPSGVEVKPAKPSDSEEFSAVVWVRLEDMLRLLRQFAR